MVIQTSTNIQRHHFNQFSSITLQMMEKQAGMPSSQFASCPPGTGLTPIHYTASLTVSYVWHVAINRSSEVPECLLQLIIHHSKGVLLWPRPLPDRQNHNHSNHFKISRTRKVKCTRAYFNPRDAFVIKTIDIKVALCLMCLDNLLAFALKAFL